MAATSRLALGLTLAGFLLLDVEGGPVVRGRPRSRLRQRRLPRPRVPSRLLTGPRKGGSSPGRRSIRLRAGRCS
jgi:hypothetical protein